MNVVYRGYDDYEVRRLCEVADPETDDELRIRHKKILAMRPNNAAICCCCVGHWHVPDAVWSNLDTLCACARRTPEDNAATPAHRLHRLNGGTTCQVDYLPNAIIANTEETPIPLTSP